MKWGLLPSAWGGSPAGGWRGQRLFGATVLVGLLLGVLPARANLWEPDSLAALETDGPRLIVRLYGRLERAKHLPGPKRRPELRRVLVQVRSAVESHRDRAIYWYLLGLTLAELDASSAASAFLESRRLGASGALESGISFYLALIYVKRHRCDLALAEYRRSMDTSTNDESRAVISANAAECEMTLGRLDRAIAGYRRALSLNPASSGARWGLAVALDRDGRRAAALRVARAALVSDPKRRSLVGPGVFFVPPVEVEYYLAVADLAAGRKQAAVRHWKKYLDGFPDSIWRSRARDHLLRLGQRPTGWRVLVRRRKSGAASPHLPASVSAVLRRGVERCLSTGALLRGSEVHLWLRLLPDRRGRVGSVFVWPSGSWRSCLSKALVGRSLGTSMRAAVDLSVFRLEDWGSGRDGAWEIDEPALDGQTRRSTRSTTWHRQ